MSNAKILSKLLGVITSLLITIEYVLADADIDTSNKQGIIIKDKRSLDKTVKLGTAPPKPQAIPFKPAELLQGNAPETQYIDLAVNKAAILRLPRPSRDVVVANPELMDVVVRSAQEIYLFAKQPGKTNAFIFDEAGRQIVNLEINIGIDTKDLERVFKEQIPDSNIKITSMADTILLSGTVKNASYAKIARDIAQRLVDSPEKIINNIGVTGQEQVMIKVKVAEIQRTILKQLGIDWNTAFQIGKFAGGFGLQNGFASNGKPGSGLIGNAINQTNLVASNIGGLPSFANSSAVQTYLTTLNSSNSALQADIDAAEQRIAALQDAAVSPTGTGSVTGAQEILINQLQNDIIVASEQIGRNSDQILQINNQVTNSASLNDSGAPQTRQRTGGFASENLAIDGLLRALERHSLLKTLAEPNLTALSGENAKFLAGGEIPYLTSQSFGQASVDFKPFGIGLAFTPMVLSNDRISLKVSTEISELTESVTSGNSSYPGLAVRRAETTVEMPSGGTMALAGLIRDDTRRSIDSTPGVKELPVLGPLFRSNDFRTSQSELIVLVTTYLAKPAHESEFGLPTDGYANPSDMDMYLKGRLAAVYDNDAKEKESSDNILDKITSSAKKTLGLDSDTNDVSNNNDEHIVE